MENELLILKIMMKEHKPVSHCDIGDKTNINDMDIVDMMQCMEKKKIIKRVPPVPLSGENKVSILYVVTEKGKKFLEECRRERNKDVIIY